MKMRAQALWICILVLCPACGAEAPAWDETTGEAEGSLVEGNALGVNGINLNGINLNGLNLNALNVASLSASSLKAIQDPGANGTLARSFIRYAVGCALNTSQTFNFTWKDSNNVIHHESYRGELGVAPTWATSPLDLNGQRFVSACLAARVNYYQVPVIISMRSLTEPLKTLTGSQELADYPEIEGAFWGNLWAPTPFIKACYNSATVANSRAWKRECATGHVLSDDTIAECGMIDIVGPCSEVCQNINGAGQYYPSCIEKPGVNTTTTKLVMTTALP
jgi:hypothetical protein